MQTGRSIVEMLGVLAIIGILSITGLWGYQLAIAKHKANETIHDVMLRAANVPMVDEGYASRANGYEWIFADLGANEGRQATFYTMTTQADHSTGYVYKVEVLLYI